MFLTKDELVELTGRKQRTKQLKQLNEMQVPYIPDALGWPKVYRGAVESLFCNSARQSKKKGLNLKALSGTVHG